jgi:hypothetical protein
MTITYYSSMEYTPGPNIAAGGRNNDQNRAPGQRTGCHAISIENTVGQATTSLAIF